MAYGAGGWWTLTISLPPGAAARGSYKYCTIHMNGAIEWEWGPNRAIPRDPGRARNIDIHDHWRPVHDPTNVLESAAFRRAICHAGSDPDDQHQSDAAVAACRCRFVIHAPNIDSSHDLYLIGNQDAVGNWEPVATCRMTRRSFPQWELERDATSLNFPLRYKYAVVNRESRKVVRWEWGEDRVIYSEKGRRKQLLVVRNDGRLRDPVPLWRGAGVAIPVFSLRSETGLGVGEFGDLKRLADWAHQTGIRLIQILPINDTVATHTWVDSYPYAAISVFALHPIYMNLAAMNVLDRDRTEAFVNEHRARLNALPTVDYEAVMTVKSTFYKLAFDETRDHFLASKPFRQFFETQQDWLVPYAAFSCLRDRFGTADYTTWPQWRRISAGELAEFVSPTQPHYDDVAVHYFIQFHLYRQLLDAADHVRSRGIVLKGDIPIGVYRHSVDTWLQPELFNMESQTGAPPDDFAVNGQNWGFPTYKWDVMARNGFAWWQRRLTSLAAYFDAFRIDHILGFFRIWEIPVEHVQGILGHFNPALPISRDELQGRGIHLEDERLCQPYIRRHLIERRFGASADDIISTYLDETAMGVFALKPAYRTQRQVVDHLAADSERHPEKREYNRATEENLLALIADVLFVRDERDPQGGFHPRHSLHSTASYQELHDDIKWRLDELYVDYFYRRHEQFWRDEALLKLPALRRATDMLICGEDLGMVPDCVGGVMHDLGLLSLFIQRMPKDPRQAFAHPSDCPYLSVCSPSSHDMSPVRVWWEGDRVETQRFYETMLGHHGLAPYYCEDWVCREIVVQHLYSPAMWAIFPLQDLLGMDAGLRRPDPHAERINEPSNPKHYWRYRMHVTLESLLVADAFNQSLASLVEQSGRHV
ncbi:MAG: 4-alpha-glucanotransferase, partial [Verrucomicrobia bacterium]|nr:4-alpha-glucanotransferase [Verrucomicrobiota bacterium]